MKSVAEEDITIYYKIMGSSIWINLINNLQPKSKILSNQTVVGGSAPSPSSSKPCVTKSYCICGIAPFDDNIIGSIDFVITSWNPYLDILQFNLMSQCV
jgi:hypothetical protein